jgi:hypothetical protein
MTFNIPRTNVIASNEGFWIEIVPPHEIRYSNGTTTWSLQMEFLTDDAVPIGVYQDTLVTEGDGTRSRRPSRMERDRIIEDIRRAFRFRGHEIDVM